MQVEVTSRALTLMRAAAAAAHPREACGILLGSGGRIISACETANVHPAPRTHFEIDPQALIDAHRAARAGGPEVVGYFHSHPAGDPVPSVTDQACVAGDGRVWAIIGPDSAGPDVRFWLDGEQGFAPLSFTIREG